MKYELARKLKEARFPQTGTSEGYVYADGITRIDPTGEHWAYAPTLEELIEACGDKLGGIDHFPYEPNNKWRVYDRAPGVLQFYGPDLSEAVANLWLALKGKE